MILFKHSADLGRYLEKERSAGRQIGFVPTMGALHAGHISLIDISKQTDQLAVCSIFVNPVQFNDPKDFQKYPVTIEKDIHLLEKAGTDVLFLPEVKEMYPEGTDSLEKYNLGFLETVLEGQYRPGHFQGVCQVMRRLLQLVSPMHLFMGQKDYQQCMIVARLLALMSSETILHTCPTLREPGGLAMSSRNARLSEADKQKAETIYQSLTYLKTACRPGDLTPFLEQARALLTAQGFRIDYVEIADAASLEKVATWDGRQRIVALIAAFLGEVRLIDNMVIPAIPVTPPGPVTPA